MSKETWQLVESNKYFRIAIFRKGLSILIFLMTLMLLLFLGIFYIYISEPEPDYYATSGVIPPIQLRAMLTPNETSNWLLQPDQPEEIEEKAIPQ